VFAHTVPLLSEFWDFIGSFCEIGKIPMAACQPGESFGQVILPGVFMTVWPEKTGASGPGRGKPERGPQRSKKEPIVAPGFFGYIL
jgi:hypothetical protein